MSAASRTHLDDRRCFRGRQQRLNYRIKELAHEDAGVPDISAAVSPQTRVGAWEWSHATLVVVEK